MAVFGVAQKAIPMPRWSRALGDHGQVPPRWRGAEISVLPSRAATPTEAAVAKAIAGGARRVPWTATCLAQAAAGQVMLRRRRSSGVLVIGLRPGPDGWGAHAWLLGRTGALTGGPAARGFTATTVFEVPGGLRAQTCAHAGLRAGV